MLATSVGGKTTVAITDSALITSFIRLETDERYPSIAPDRMSRNVSTDSTCRTTWSYAAREELCLSRLRYGHPRRERLAATPRLGARRPRSARRERLSAELRSRVPVPWC